MKGDLSNLTFLPSTNITGVLHQQGRVLTDQDWNAADEIHRRLRQALAGDAIGRNVVAVPASEPDSFKVIEASGNGNVEITLVPGRVWVDGLPVYISTTKPSVIAPADYLGLLFQEPPEPIAEDVRDAVILEVWEEALSAFQEPRRLIEPALGGPDTTERVRLAYALRLLRLKPGEDCHNLAARLADDFDAKGHLYAKLQPTTDIIGECPVQAGGGYTGFEHYLYRIEIAGPSENNEAQFKWSRFNGGLVGRGTFTSTGPHEGEVTITANDQMINQCGLTSFYFEALGRSNKYPGNWEVQMTANASLTADGKLSLTSITDTWPGDPSEPAFFHLWDGVRLIKEFQTGLPDDQLELELGIRLEFDPPAPDNTNYTPGDYWTFKVRAAGVEWNPPNFLAKGPPHGIHYHRAPLAILNRGAGLEPKAIDDCRHVFQPLAKLDTCCTVTVGDGSHSVGDFDSIEEAIRFLPGSGGQVCVLVGVHQANVTLEGRHDIVIKGCGPNTKIIPQATTANLPVFHIKDCSGIVIEHVDLATLEGTALLLEGTESGDLQNIAIRHNRILAAEEAIRISRGVEVHIHNNKIRLLDRQDAGVAIYMMAEDSTIERNEIAVVPAEETPLVETPDDQPDIDPLDLCARFDRLYVAPVYYARYMNTIWEWVITLPARNPYSAPGGVQIAGSSERIKVRENNINGGAGNGMTLGNPVESGELPNGNEQHTIDNINRIIQGVLYDEAGNPAPGIELLFASERGNTATAGSENDGTFYVVAPADKYLVTVNTPGYQIDRVSYTDTDNGRFYSIYLVKVEEEPGVDDSLGFIYELDIESNEIVDMGLSGIGCPMLEESQNPFTAAFRNQLPGSTIVGLRIQRNRINHCLKNPFDMTMSRQAQLIGLGGVSLYVCEETVISQNRIEDNGINHNDPVCGVFAIGGHIEIMANQISNNAPIAGTVINDDFVNGIRGGVVLTVSPSILPAELSPFSLPAARLHDNLVNQPIGPAVDILASGTVSVESNHLNSEYSAPSARFKQKVLGSVYIMNSAENVTLFNSNQIRLGLARNCIFSEWIEGGEIGFDGNQSTVERYDGAFVINTYLRATTLRATDNRFRELQADIPGAQADLPSLILSLQTRAPVMNNTSHNQGDHCIIAQPAPVPGNDLPTVYIGNQMLNAEQCKELMSGLASVPSMSLKELPQYRRI